MDKSSAVLQSAAASAIPGRTGFDTLVVGAGFAGSVLAERLASQMGQRVLVVDKRPHIGGNAYDRHDDAGILIHPYGPHIFHTNSADIFEYLSQFTEWRPYQHRVLASVDGQQLPMPINLDTVNTLYGTHFTSFEIEQFFASVENLNRAMLVTGFALSSAPATASGGSAASTTAPNMLTAQINAQVFESPQLAAASTPATTASTTTTGH